MPQLTSNLRDEWERYAIAVIEKRLIQHPELRAEAREAFIGGLGAMYRIFCEEIARIPSQSRQAQAVRELFAQLQAFALEAGRR